MPVLRFTRDKRGYEHFSLVESITNRRGKTRTRVLYWYRTPPNVRVGREPFAESVRRELEAQNPDVQFDWRKIVETPIPSAETERWRERRRAEKAEKAARRARTPEIKQPSVEAIEPDAVRDADDEIAETMAAPEGVEAARTSDVPSAGVDIERVRRRRRRRRGRRRGSPNQPGQPAEPDQQVEAPAEAAPEPPTPDEA